MVIGWNVLVIMIVMFMVVADDAETIVDRLMTAMAMPVMAMMIVMVVMMMPLMTTQSLLLKPPACCGSVPGLLGYPPACHIAITSL